METETETSEGVVEPPIVRLFRCYGGCEHHANSHTAYAESPDAFIKMIRAQYGNKYPLSEPEELMSTPNA